MESWWRDLRFGARSLLRSPTVTLLGLLTLALGIGANTAIFSVVDGVLIEPLPLLRPDQIVVLIDSAPKLGLPEFASSPPNFKDWREQNHVFASLDAMRLRRLTLTGNGGEPQALAGAAVTGDFFRTVGIQPLAGRLLGPQDDRPGGEGLVVVLGSDLWRQRFGGDPGIVNRQVTLDGHPHTVVGIAASTFDFPRQIQLWVPLALDYAKERRQSRYLHVVGRLKPGVSLERAQADMSAIAGRLARQYPDQNAAWGVVLTRLRDLMVQDIRPALIVLQLAVIVVLLIACVNVANLQLARMGAREREIAVRAVLGAGRLRLARQIVAESVVLFAAGGALGLLVGLWGTRSLVALDPDAIPRAEGIGVDGRVLGGTLLVAVVSGMVFGVVPAASAVGGHLHGALREGGFAIAGGRRGRLLRSGLVLGEVALALTLLVGAGLLLQSFARLQAVDPGFRPEGVITGRLSLPASRYSGDPRLAAFFQQALDRVRALPGVQHAASVYPLPLAESTLIASFVVEGRPALEPGEAQTAQCHFISPDYFRTMEIPQVTGRPFSAQDDIKSPRVAIVNRVMAARIWPGQDPLGQRISFGKGAKPEVQWMRVVGVVGDVRAAELTHEPEMEIYCPQFQTPVAGATLVVRTTADPRSLIAPIRRAIQQLDVDLPLDKVQTLEQVISRSVAEDRVKALLLGVFAAIALLLAAIGVFGLVSYSVAQRVHEIGIRVALGARKAEMVRMIVLQGMKPVAIGIGVGLVGAYAAGRLLENQLYEVGVADPLTYLGVPCVLCAVALLANWLAARRATRVDPLEALRYE
ncbi:MAG TPA: ABC transporter permease [Thermoanaerobaculia bacterium]|nr:ABC transporter permease [Thermoanaerobaculia bacterium]